MSAVVGRDSVKETINHAKRDYIDATIAASINIDKIAINAVYIGSHQDYSGDANTNGMHYYYSAIKYGGVKYRVRMQLKETQSGNNTPHVKLYLESVELIPEGRTGGDSTATYESARTDSYLLSEMPPVTDGAIPQSRTSIRASLTTNSIPPSVTDQSGTISIYDLLRGVNLNQMRNFTKLSSNDSSSSNSDEGPISKAVAPFAPGGDILAMAAPRAVNGDAQKVTGGDGAEKIHNPVTIANTLARRLGIGADTGTRKMGVRNPLPKNVLGYYQRGKGYFAQRERL